MNKKEIFPILKNLIENGSHKTTCFRIGNRDALCTCGRYGAIKDANGLIDRMNKELLYDPHEDPERVKNLEEKYQTLQAKNAKATFALEILLKMLERYEHFPLKWDGREIPWVQLHARAALQERWCHAFLDAMKEFAKPENWQETTRGPVWMGEKHPLKLAQQNLGSDSLETFKVP